MVNLLTADEGNHATQDYQDTRVRGRMLEPGDSFADGEGAFSIWE